MLSPADFGLVAMIAVFVTLGNLLRDFGMPMAALQSPNLNHQQASNLFWVNTGLATSAAALLAAATPAVVTLYSEPRLAGVAPVMALIILIGGIGSQIQVDLARRMRFVAIVASEVGGQALGLGVAVASAAAGFGYWALVAQGLVAAVSTLVARWALSRWAPTRFRRGYGSMSIIRAGFHYGAAYLLSFLQSNADTLLIGALQGATPLGYYNRAYQIFTAPASRLMDPLTQVVVPMLNGAREEGRSTSAILLKVEFIVGSAVVAVFATVGAAAPQLVPVVLGPGWGPTIAVFQILALGGCLWVFNHVSYWVFITKGLSAELLHYNLVSKPVAVAFLAVGAFGGIQGVAWGYVAGMAFSWPLNLFWLTRAAHLPWQGFLRNGLLALSGGAIGAIATAAVCRVLEDAVPLVAGLLGVLAGLVGMLIWLLILPASRVQLRDAKALIRARRSDG